METMGWGEGNEESRKIEKQRERWGGERERETQRQEEWGRKDNRENIVKFIHVDGL